MSHIKSRPFKSNVPPYSSPFGGPIPGPWTTVTVQWSGVSESVQGILDTGADYTQVPEAVAQRLRLRPTGYRTFVNADGSQARSRLYVADVEVDGRNFPSLEVTGSQLRIALIGRDILNTLVSEFDGPSLDYSLRP